MKGKLNISMFLRKKERSLYTDGLNDNLPHRNDPLKKGRQKDSLQLKSFVAGLNTEELVYLIYKHHPQGIS
ncbi:MAG TPA: hypothetical protein VJI15_04090 [Candidatus Nanoarchaeia archaeon]|nr:hypothetical protein [Candidatus Nanoarchaeia archaeon]